MASVACRTPCPPRTGFLGCRPSGSPGSLAGRVGDVMQHATSVALVLTSQDSRHSRGRHHVAELEAGATERLDDVVARVRAGDTRALELLFREHYAALCEFSVRYVRQPSLAEELVQDVFADLWARRERWYVHGSVCAYLFAAVRNRALNLR